MGVSYRERIGHLSPGKQEGTLVIPRNAFPKPLHPMRPSPSLYFLPLLSLLALTPPCAAQDTEAKPVGTTGSFTCVSGGKTVTQIAVAADGIIIIAKKNGNAAKCIAALVRNLFSAP